MAESPTRIWVESLALPMGVSEYEREYCTEYVRADAVPALRAMSEPSTLVGMLEQALRRIEKLEAVANAARAVYEEARHWKIPKHPKAKLQALREVLFALDE